MTDQSRAWEDSRITSLKAETVYGVLEVSLEGETFAVSLGDRRISGGHETLIAAVEAGIQKLEEENT